MASETVCQQLAKGILVRPVCRGRVTTDLDISVVAPNSLEVQLSSGYRSLRPIPYIKLIDGRLMRFGVRIEVPANTANGRRCLVGGDGVLWVYRMHDGSCEFARFAGSLPFSVLDAIEEEFRTEVVNHHDYRYWGFGSEQEMEANYAEMSKPCAQTHVVPLPSEKSVLAAIRSKIQSKKQH